MKDLKDLGHAERLRQATQAERLIREHARDFLQHETSIQLANVQFDTFVEACSDPERKPSVRILEAAKRLDKEGF